MVACKITYNRVTYVSVVKMHLWGMQAKAALAKTEIANSSNIRGARHCVLKYFLCRHLYTANMYTYISTSQNTVFLKRLCAWWDFKNIFARPLFFLLFRPKMVEFHPYSIFYKSAKELGSVAGPVIQANGRLSFEDDLRSGGLLYCVSQWISIRTELADSMVTLGEPRDG